MYQVMLVLRCIVSSYVGIKVYWYVGIYVMVCLYVCV